MQKVLFIKTVPLNRLEKGIKLTSNFRLQHILNYFVEDNQNIDF